MLAVDGEVCFWAFGVVVRLQRLRISLRCVSGALLGRLLTSNVRRPAKSWRGAACGWLASVLRLLAH